MAHGVLQLGPKANPAASGERTMTNVEAIVWRSFLNPATLFGALFYAVAFLLLASLAASGLRVACQESQGLASATRTTGLHDATTHG